MTTPLKAVVASLIIGYLYGQGGAMQALAVAILVAVSIAPGPDGRPLAAVMLDTLSGYLRS